MANVILNDPDIRARYESIVTVFANTGQEREETLDFVDKCDKHFGLNVVWLEAVVHNGARKGTTHSITSYIKAERKGKPFEDVIRKYGIPNQAFPHCTRELKIAPINSYVKSLGWKTGTFHMAVGIRADEFDRMSVGATLKGIVYPLIQWAPTTKPEVNAWWKSQPFRLPLKGYQGNCSWCWKKSMRKHLTLIDEAPEIYNFPREMERKYGRVGYEFTVAKSGQHTPLAASYKRTFFRKSMSTDDLFEEYERERWKFLRSEDDHTIMPDGYSDLDAQYGCEESCEVHA